MIDALLTGVSHVFAWPGILIPIGGTVLAMVVSFLPGIGGTSVMAVMMVLTLSWEVESVLLLFGALTGGATFMGSITAILFNIPGSAPSAPALLDGYPLGRNGYPKMAIACAATASAVGSIFGVAVLLALLPAIRPFLLEFGPLERLLLGLWGLVAIVAVPNTSPLKSAAMAALGILAAMIGSDPVSAEMRWAFGTETLRDGLGMLPALLGFFTLAEVIGWTLHEKVRRTGTAAAPRDSVRAGVAAVFRHPGLTLRSSLIGTMVGAVPGVGGTVAGFVAYGHAVQTAHDDRSQFGKGDIRGLIAPEAAVDAKDGGSLLPVVAFGLPGSEAGVILVTVLALHGLVPGTPMLTTQLPLTMTLIVALLFSNLLTSVVGVLLTPWLARLTSLRIDRIALPVLVLSLFAVVQVDARLSDLYVAVGFGLAGYVFKRCHWPRVPFVIAFVLGKFIETNLALSARLLELGRLDPLQRPVALVIFALVCLSAAWMLYKTRGAHDSRPFDRADARIAATGLAVCAVLAAAAASATTAYSPISWAALGLATLLLVAVVVRCILRPAPAASSPALWLPPAHRLPLGALAGLPVLTWLLGLPLGLALMVLTWMGARGGRRAAVPALLAALATGAAAWFLIEEVFHLILPPGWLWALFPS